MSASVLDNALPPVADLTGAQQPQHAALGLGDIGLLPRLPTDPFDPIDPLDPIDPGDVFFRAVEVKFGAITVADNDTTPSDAEGTEFGSVLFGAAAPIRSFTVSNTGTLPITLGTVTATGDFEIVSGLPATLAVGADASMTVRMNTSSFSANGEIRFSTNVTGKNPYNFNVHGSTFLVLEPLPLFFPELTVLDNAGTPVDDGASTVDFGAVAEGSAAPTRIFTVRNDGNINLTLGTPSVPAGFTIVDGLVSTLAPGASDDFSVAMSTSTAGEKTGDVSFVTNDSNENPYSFTVRGSVVAAVVSPITGTLDASKVPGVVVGGQKKSKGKVTLFVTNTTANPIQGNIAAAIVASTDGAVDATDLPLGTASKNLKLKPGQTKSVKAKVTFPVPAADGNFNLLASMTFNGTPAGLAVGNRTVRIERPLISLSAQTISGGVFALGRTIKLNLPVTNTGNVAAKGTLNLDLLASTDGTTTPTTSFALATLANVKASIKPGATKTVKLTFTMPATLPAPFTPGNYTLVVKTVSSSLGAPNATDGQVLANVPFTIA